MENTCSLVFMVAVLIVSLINWCSFDIEPISRQPLSIQHGFGIMAQAKLLHNGTFELYLLTQSSRICGNPGVSAPVFHKLSLTNSCRLSPGNAQTQRLNN